MLAWSNGWGTGGSSARASLFVAVVASMCVAIHPGNAFADVVTLKDGAKIEGRVVSMDAGKEVVIELPDTTRKTVAWADLREIQLPPGAQAAPEETSPPKVASKPKSDETADQANVGKNGGKKKKKKKDTSVTNVDMADSDVHATYHAETDCSESDEEDCKAITNGSASKSGLSLSYSEESVADVDQPKHGSTNFSLAASAIGGFGDNITMVGGNAALSVRFLTGSQFPGKFGGSWFGVFFEPSFSGGGTSITVKSTSPCIPTGFGRTYCPGTSNSTSGAGIIIATFGAGFQWMYFGSRNAKTKKQSGFGIALGGVVGYQKTFSRGNNDSGSATYGPQLSFLFPSYNAGTTSFSNFQINLFVLPTKDFVLVLGGLQYSFG